MRRFFNWFATKTSTAAGQPFTFVTAVAVILVWAVTGPMFHYSDTWQLIINTGTTIVTFLMVFLIQNTQNRDTQAIQLKLDELIRVNAKARNRMVTLEDLTEEELDKVKAQFANLAERAPAQSRGHIAEAERDLQEATRELQEAEAKAQRPQRSSAAE
jgi:low affinity Fe/Cu permease